MTTPLLITCPQCHKQSQAPPEAIGKKVRCKGCGHVFEARAVAARSSAKPPTKPAAPPPAKPAAATIPLAADDDDDGPPAYGVTDMSLAPRCPHCAKEMPSSEAVICLNCGYDIRSRTRAESKYTIETTPGDWALHLLPGIGCVVAVLIVLGLDILVIIKMPDWMKDGWFDNGDGTYVVKPGAFSLWVVIFSMAIVVPCVRFAYKRLVKNYTPPEKVVKT